MNESKSPICIAEWSSLDLARWDWMTIWLDLPAIVKKIRKNKFDLPQLKIYFSTTKNPLKKAGSRVSKFYREVQPLYWKYGTVQMLLNRSAQFMEMFNLLIENMALFKCSWTTPCGSWNYSILQLKIWRGSNMCKTVQKNQIK